MITADELFRFCLIFGLGIPVGIGLTIHFIRELYFWLLLKYNKKFQDWRQSDGWIY